MRMTSLLPLGLAVLACGSLSACAGSTEADDCVSRYSPVATAATWGRLQDEMLSYDERGRVASVRTQAQGQDVGAGDQEAVRVVDLLDSKGHRLVQAEVWRTDTGDWRAGIWSQCID
jgi:hypothetical protein